METTEKRQPGGQRGNAHAARHGMRSNRAGLILPRMGKRYASVYHNLCDLRKAVEGHIREAQGQVTLQQASKIQTLMRLEAGCRCLELEMRVAGKDGIPLKDLISARNSIVVWTRSRDNLLAELLGDIKPADDPMAWFDDEVAAFQANGFSEPAAESVTESPAPTSSRPPAAAVEPVTPDHGDDQDGDDDPFGDLDAESSEYGRVDDEEDEDDE